MGSDTNDNFNHKHLHFSRQTWLICADYHIVIYADFYLIVQGFFPWTDKQGGSAPVNHNYDISDDTGAEPSGFHPPGFPASRF